MSVIVTHPATVTQFEALKAALQSDHKDVEKVSFTDLTSGTIETKDVELGFNYTDGILTATVLKKNSFEAKLAPESTLHDKLESLLTGFLGS